MTGGRARERGTDRQTERERERERNDAKQRGYSWIRKCSQDLGITTTDGEGRGEGKGIRTYSQDTFKGEVWL